MASGEDSNTVLIVDDESEGRAAIVNALGKTNVKVQECDSALSLNRFLDQQPWTWVPTLAFVELVLPVTSGYDVIRRLRERFGQRKIPIIVVSRMSTGEDIMDAQVAGADAFVRKPFEPDTLMSAVNGCMDELKKPATDRRHTIAYYL